MNLSELITITPDALEYLRALVNKKQAYGFYLKIKNSGCSGVRYDPQIVTEAPAGDIISGDFSGLNVFIDANAAEILKDTVIDCKEMALKQKQIVYRNPNAEDVCGCGESFNVRKDDE